MRSVLQDWVMALPLRYQGTLLTGIRGCDLTPKIPGENPPERDLVAFLRWCVMNPADEREVDFPGAFFQSRPPTSWKPSQFGHYPLHWFSHLMHCYEIIGYEHPTEIVRSIAYDIYARLVSSLHLNVEDHDQMHERLTEDRIANDTVVS